MGWFGSDTEKKKDPFDTLKLNNDEREQIALGNLAPTYEAIMKFRKKAVGKPAVDINITAKKPMPIKRKQPRGLGNTERLLKTMEEMQNRKKAIRQKGTVRGILGL